MTISRTDCLHLVQSRESRKISSALPSIHLAILHDVLGLPRRRFPCTFPIRLKRALCLQCCSRLLQATVWKAMGTEMVKELRAAKGNWESRPVVVILVGSSSVTRGCNSLFLLLKKNYAPGDYVNGHKCSLTWPICSWCLILTHTYIMNNKAIGGFDDATWTWYKKVQAVADIISLRETEEVDWDRLQ